MLDILFEKLYDIDRVRYWLVFACAASGKATKEETKKQFKFLKEDT